MRTALLLLLLTGCASPSTPAPRAVGLAEFSRPASSPAAQADDPYASVTTDRAEPDDPLASDDGDEVLSSPEDFLEVIRPLEPGESTIVDSLVGQVNGRPIYAHDFFLPIGDELRALGERTATRREFRLAAMEVIRGRLSQVVLDELFLAEAESQLSPEQRQGLLYFMNALREGVIGREGGGTRAQAEESLREQEGVSVEEYVELRKDEALLRNLFSQKIEARVIVSWRDIEREYHRRLDEFQPPAVAYLGRIRLATQRNEGEIAEVQSRLEAGEPFEVVADEIGMADGGQWDEFELGPEGLGGIDLRDEIRSEIAHLSAGQTSAPFQLGRSTWWLHLDEIEQPEGRSIYDPQVQRLLMAQILGRRRLEEQNRYIGSLMAEGIYDELQEMGEALLKVAMDRYGPG